MEQETQLQEQTRTHISQALGLTLVSLAGLAAAASFWFFGAQKQQTTTTTTTTTNTSTTQTVDLTNAPLVTAASKPSPADYAQAVADSSVTATNGVVVTITSPAEGAFVDDTQGNYVTAQLTDPNSKVDHLYIRTFNDRYGFLIGWYNIKTPPYTWNTALSLYPSGEYRDVVYAMDASNNVLATADVMYTKTHHCYYLAYQDMTLTGPTTSVTAGKTFNMAVTVKNHQRGACTYKYLVDTKDPLSLNSLLPDGWTATISPTTNDPQKGIYGLPIGIEETKSFAVTVQVPATVATGTYNVGVSSNLIYTGFIVTKTANVSVTAVSGGGGGGPSKIPSETTP